jgi:Tfp pilus assembly PilM family ATPase
MAKGSSVKKTRNLRAKTFFPPLQFLSLNHCGIDISQGAVRFIRFNDSSREVKVKVFGETTDSKTENVDEKIDMGVSKNALELVLKKIGTRFVRVIIPEDEVYLFRMKTPKVHDAELRNVIDFKLEENVPIPRANTLFEYDIIETIDDEYLISVSAISDEFVSKAITLIESAGMTPILFDTEGRSVARALSSSDAVELVVAFNKYYTSLIITKNGIPLFSSTTPIGSDDMTRALMKGLKVEEDDVVKLKKVKTGGDMKETPDISSDVSGVISSLKDEINKVITYWNSHGKKEGFTEVVKILLTGTDLSLSEVLKNLEASTKLPVEMGNIWVNVFSLDHHVPDMSKEESMNYASLVGISLN